MNLFMRGVPVTFDRVWCRPGSPEWTLCFSQVWVEESVGGSGLALKTWVLRVVSEPIAMQLWQHCKYRGRSWGDV
jgi:hypothetical protein